MFKSQYTKVPPNKLCSRDKAKIDDAAAGAMALIVDAVVCAKPFVAPNEDLSGTASVKYMNTQPGESTMSLSEV